jgi:hypothetical protein
VESSRQFIPVHSDAGSLLSVVVHSQEADIHDVHETVPKAANFCTARLAVTVRLQFKNALGECRQEVFHLALRPAIQFPRLDEFFCQVGEQIAQFPVAMDGSRDCYDGSVVVAEVQVELLVGAFKQRISEADQHQTVNEFSENFVNFRISNLLLDLPLFVEQAPQLAKIKKELFVELFFYFLSMLILKRPEVHDRVGTVIKILEVQVRKLFLGQLKSLIGNEN